MKLQESKRDQYRRKARKEGYRSRAAYKLLQLNTKYKILKKGMRVVDFGCAPGGWLQVASNEVGPSGRILGVDLQEVQEMDNNVKTLVADVSDRALVEIVLRTLPGRAEAVLSDLSPNVSGIWDLDHTRQIDMCQRVKEALPSILEGRGRAILKAFEGDQLQSLVKGLRSMFKTVDVTKPSASRGASSEVYLVCLDFSG